MQGNERNRTSAREGDGVEVIRGRGSYHAQIPVWVLDGEISDRAVRLYGVLARYAGTPERPGWPGRETLAARLRCSVSSIKRARDELVAFGAIDYEERPGRSNLYYVHATPPAAADPVHGRPDTRFTGEPATRFTGDPQKESQVKESHENESHSARASTAIVLSPDGPQYVAPTNVDRKPVTQAEATKAALVLHVWNERAGQELRATSWLGKIIMRLREYPEATVDDHALIIETALAHPWWRGAASPSVVYGNDAQFERSIQAVRERRREDTRIEDILTRVGRAA